MVVLFSKTSFRGGVYCGKVCHKRGYPSSFGKTKSSPGIFDAVRKIVLDRPGLFLGMLISYIYCKIQLYFLIVSDAVLPALILSPVGGPCA